MFAWFTDALSNPKSKIKIVDKTKFETYFNAAGKYIHVCINAPQLKTHFNRFFYLDIFFLLKKIVVLFQS